MRRELYLCHLGNVKRFLKINLLFWYFCWYSLCFVEKSAPSVDARIGHSTDLYSLTSLHKLIISEEFGPAPGTGLIRDLSTRWEGQTPDFLQGWRSPRPAAKRSKSGQVLPKAGTYV
jgi:hypothetical protein